ncbi:bifunctional hydroxymethylpyrimidine kinase/phosphomethylpyrimidine kinase [Treponema sp. R6D11]
MNILAIHDISTMGKAGLNVVVPVLSSFGHTVSPMPTCALSSITGGFGEYYKTDLTTQMIETLEHIKRIGAKFDYVYSGYLSAPAQAEIVAEVVKHTKAKFLCDPVMGDNGKLYSGYDEGIIDAMRGLVAIADIATPNYTEAKFLGEIKTPAVTITSYPNAAHEEINVLCTLEGMEHIIEGNYKPKEISGAGDAFASYLIGYGLEGNAFFESAQLACEAVGEMLQ